MSTMCFESLVFRGKKVQIQNGKIYVDDKEISYPVGEEPIEDAGIANDIVLLQDDEYFMLCDNYNNSSYDSRSPISE